MKYSYEPNSRSFCIHNVDANVHLGDVDIPAAEYPVRNAEGDVIAVVNSIEDAIHALLDHYKKHPRQWERSSASEYVKLTQFGRLDVGQEPLGFWSVYRNRHEILLYDGKPAVFRTTEEAKHAADAHMGDELEKLSNDGFEWFSMDHA